MKKMKRVLCFVLAVLMLVSINVPAFAVGEQGNSTDNGAPLSIEVSTNKSEYSTLGVAKFDVTVTNTSGADIQNVSAEAVFKQLSPAGRNSETKKEIDTLKAGESISFSYKATINKEEYNLNFFEKVFLWLVRLFNGGFTASDNGFDDGRTSIEKIDTISFGKLSAENTIKVWYGEKKATSDDYQALIEGVDINELYEYDNNDISTDEETDLEYINNIIIIMFDNQCSNERKAEVINSVNGKVVGGDIIYNELYVQIEKSTLEELEDFCEKLNNEEGVYLARYEEFSTDTVSYTLKDPFENGEENSKVEWNVDDNNFNTSYNNWWALATYLRQAWGYDQYFSKINIGIADTGFDTTHEDLRGKIHVISKENSPDNHGTHVAGIIGATHNDIGIAGIVRNSTLYGYDVATNNGKFKSETEHLKALKKLVIDYDCKIINFSIGKEVYINNNKVYCDKNFKRGLTDKKVNTWGEEASKKIADLLKEGNDFIVVQAAGNGGKNTPHIGIDADNNGYFAAITKNNCYSDDNVSVDEIMNRVITVANSNKHGVSKSDYILNLDSNGGNQVDIAAPGSNIYSTVAGIKELYDDGSIFINEGQQYAHMSGTSMAAPIVTGVAGLVWSVNPNFTGAQVKKIIMDTAKQGGIVAKDNPASPTTGDFYLVNAKLAVKAALERTYNRVYGNVKNKVNNNSITDVTVSAIIPGSGSTTPVATTTTDESGNFTLHLPNGTYALIFTHDNYEDYAYQVIVNGSDVTLSEPILLMNKNTNIPSTAVEFNGHYYQVYDESMTWTEAKKYCESLGGHLATITSQEEQQFIESQLVNGQKSCYWLGGTDSAVEGKWNWVTGEEFSYTKWGADMPDNWQDEDYLMIYKDPHPSHTGNTFGFWNDLKENGTCQGTSYFRKEIFGFICEWDEFIPQTPKTVTALGNCGANNGDNLKWILYDDGELVISGKGEMFNNAYPDNYSWYNYRKKVKTITIEDEVTSIGYGAFIGFTSLTSINIGNGVTSIIRPFNECTSLINVTVDKNNKNYYSSPDGVLFNKDKTELISYPSGKKETSYIIPNGVMSIGIYALSNCTSLANVKIPDTVTSIGYGAFSRSSLLTYVTIPDSVTVIGELAFSSCSSLSSITIKNRKCSIYDRTNTISETATIYGYLNSTTHAYAEKYNRKFVALD